MLLHTPLFLDWCAIFVQRMQFVNDTLTHANKKHINFDYQSGQKVLKYDNTLKGKLKTKATQHYEILRVYPNGPMTIILRPDITKCINVHYTLPYQEPTPS